MTDNPTTTSANGDQFRALDGKPHRTDGPAVIFADGTQEWFQHGQMHRTDDPAVENHDGTADQWHANGVELSDGDVHFIRKLDQTTRAEVLGLYSAGARASHLHAALLAARP
jgi:hypothetical protein